MKMTKVFESGKIGNLQVKNRLLVSAMSTHLGNPDGTPTEAVTQYHETKARGGWGMVFTEDLGVTEDAGCDPHVGSLWKDEQIASWTEFVKRIHAAGGKIGAQIYHAGRERSLKAYDTKPVAPSAVKEPAMGYIPRALKTEEIKDLVQAFGQCAARVKACGFDCVEIHGSHGYLINQFMSGFSNKRHDIYGGTLINRMRFPLEIVEAVRQAVGPDYPVVFRMNTSDYVDGGIELPEAVVMAKMLEEAGVDALHCTQGMYASKENIIPPAFIPMMNYMNNVETIKKSVKIPVIAVGRINDIFLAEALLRDGKADFVAMARASLADPDLPKKAEQGRYEDIIHCIGCDQGCTGEAAVGGAVNCLVNPFTAKETAYDYSLTEHPKKVFIAGAGVAGLAAALAAATKGHEVRIYEKTEDIGGQWNAATVPPGKSEYQALLVFYRQQLEKKGVQILLKQELNRDIVEAEKPDTVILATGGIPLLLPIPGLDDSNMVRSAIDVLNGKTTFGRNILVAGGGLVGVETAIFLASQGCDVKLIEMASGIVMEAVSQPKACLLAAVKKYQIEVHTNTRLMRVEAGRVYAEEYGQPITFDRVDLVVNAMGVRSYNPLEEQLKDCDCQVLVVGDAKKSKNGYKNIREGFEAGISLE